MSKNILLLITGSVSCYKALDLLRKLQKDNFNIKVILTNSALKFISKTMVSSLTGQKTFTDIDDFDENYKMTHIELSRWADEILVAPASANIISKTAHGMADDLASLVLLSADQNKCQITFAPSMNVRMWNNRFVQNNLKILQENAINIVMPEEGEMACGEIGVGKFPEPETIINHMKNMEKKS